MTNPPITCTALTKSFGALVAVDHIDLTLPAGTVLGFIGPNGAGKSTTIRMMLGLSAPTSGRVRLFGADPRTERGVRRRIGYSPGELRLDERLSVRATLDTWSTLRGGVDTTYRAELVERLGVPIDRAVRGLSTGNRRKVALVGALMARPELLILDEPTNGLDPLVQHELMTILGETVATGTSLLLSSHVLSEVERIADRIVVIRQGRIVADGPTEQLRAGAAQDIRIRFDGARPEPQTIAALPGCQSVDDRHEGELHLTWQGPITPLIHALDGFDVASFIAPEPDLESAFRAFYESDAAAQEAA